MCNCKRLGTDEQVSQFNGILEKYKGQKDNIMTVLQKTQSIFGYIPEGFTLKDGLVGVVTLIVIILIIFIILLFTGIIKLKKK